MHLFDNSTLNSHNYLAQTISSTIIISRSAIGFRIPSLVELLSFVLRFFFIIAGLLALFFMLLGALAWVTSGGEKDKVDAARKKITSTIVGIIIMIFVLAIIATLEQVVFRRTICFGLTCPISIPTLLTPSNSSTSVDIPTPTPTPSLIPTITNQPTSNTIYPSAYPTYNSITGEVVTVVP